MALLDYHANFGQGRTSGFGMSQTLARQVRGLDMKHNFGKANKAFEKSNKDELGFQD